jgi:predicted Zn-dependent peptidase
MLNEVVAQGVTSSELARAKAMIRSQRAVAAETNAEIAALIGEYEIGGNFEDALRFETKLQQVSKEDVRRVAKIYLTRPFVVAAVQPDGGK